MTDSSNNFHEYKKILEKIYLKIKRPRYISTYDKKNLESMINKIDNTNHNLDTTLLTRIKENLRSLEFIGPERDIEKNRKDLLDAILQLISWLG